MAHAEVPWWDFKIAIELWLLYLLMRHSLTKLFKVAIEDTNNSFSSSHAHKTRQSSGFSISVDMKSSFMTRADFEQGNDERNRSKAIQLDHFGVNWTNKQWEGIRSNESWAMEKRIVMMMKKTRTENDDDHEPGEDDSGAWCESLRLAFTFSCPFGQNHASNQAGKNLAFVTKVDVWMSVERLCPIIVAILRKMKMIS